MFKKDFNCCPNSLIHIIMTCFSLWNGILKRSHKNKLSIDEFDSLELYCTIQCNTINYYNIHDIKQSIVIRKDFEFL